MSLTARLSVAWLSGLSATQHLLVERQLGEAVIQIATGRFSEYVLPRWLHRANELKSGL